MPTTTKTKTNGNGKAVGAVAAQARAVAGSAPLLEIDRIAEEILHVPIVGTTPLIVHRFSEKAKRQMLDGFQGKKSPKQPKNPQAEFEAASYHLTDGGYGLPADAFKQATVGAARFYGKDISMTALK